MNQIWWDDEGKRLALDLKPRTRRAKLIRAAQFTMDTIIVIMGASAVALILMVELVPQ